MTVLAFQQRRLIRASEISDNHMGRHLRIGDVEGVLKVLDPRRAHVVVVLDVGGLKAEFHLLPGAAVEVGRRA